VAQGAFGRTGGAEEEDWVAVARLTRTWGNRGELAAIPLSGHPGRFERLAEVKLRGAEGFPGGGPTLVVESVRRHGARLIFKFQGVESITEAEKLRGAEVCVPPAERWPPPPGEWYVSDLIGCEVVDRMTGERLGRVTAWLEIGGAGTLEVAAGEGGRELWIPFARSICCEIDLEARRITVQLPEGLKELNA
jgi:16S rRNA processing protein RimM